jgi:phosphatidylethanolamine-binding protein (PEBP) family uncharacterized protein
MSKAVRLLLLLFIPAATLGLQTGANAFSASFSWAGITACQTVSPAFTLRDVPPGTKQLRFIMHDEQVPSFQHGGSTIPYRGSDAIPRGAVHYIGPCPPKGERHQYRWAVDALDGSGKVLGQTTARAVFPP